jgi:predicted nuclease with TOPRIM domain
MVAIKSEIEKLRMRASVAPLDEMASVSAEEDAMLGKLNQLKVEYDEGMGRLQKLRLEIEPLHRRLQEQQKTLLVESRT